MISLVTARDLARTYQLRRSVFGRPVAVRAVDGVSLHVGAGETLGIVGESGSGKSTLGRMVLGLEKPDGGAVTFDGAPMPEPLTAAWRRSRARMQMIYQDPLGALDRRLTVRDQVAEPLAIHGLGASAERMEKALAMLGRVGLSRHVAMRYPHELSGGQRQRVVLARALMTDPAFLVCDEPVSALDVSIQAQVVNLLVDLQESLGIAMLFISHDLRVVRQVSRRVAVMYLGRIVEEGDADDLFADPRHPYTRALVSAAPAPGGKRERIILTGEPPNPAARPPGCAFHPRCPLAEARCRETAPALTTLGGGRRVACHVVAGPAAATREAA
ncbi:ABC transporter ATP-binding protein [Phreatobacter oligotrophus]|uniref:ABC transporter ATP-binding protein n=1 Tax=Phreatobacter oligotrophus TaxID=1122261 RepID=UPI002356444D|nr:oligopeptide/dipeptide ABC transporter ATP-binding protein [Phreatobacter oligotrophus]MBX9991418.1 ATP-binding cassette domain-containing protein [Phreatobacter oligotrophus]